MAIMAVVLLPAVSAASIMATVPIFEGIAQIPSSEIAATLADKSMAYWFVTLAVVAIGSWTWIFKWLIAQLDSQRKANSEAQQQTIAYMSQDHAAVAALTANTIDVLRQVTEILGQVKAVLINIDKSQK